MLCRRKFTVVVIRLHRHVRLLVTPWTAVLQASPPFTISQSLLKLMFTESKMPSSHLILCRPLFLLPSIVPSIRVFFSESAHHVRKTKYWSFSFSISPANEYSGLIRLHELLAHLLWKVAFKSFFFLGPNFSLA